MSATTNDWPVVMPGPIGEIEFCHLAELESLEPLADAISASMRADGIDQTVTAEELDNFNKHHTDFDASRDSLIANYDGQPAGEAYVIQLMESGGPHVYLYHVYLRLEARSDPVFHAMRDWAEAHAIALHQAAGAPRPAVLRVFAGDGESWLREALEVNGYQIERYFYDMVRKSIGQPEIPPLPDGIEIRQVKSEHMRQIWDAKEEAFEDHWGHRQKDENDYQLFLNDPVQDPALWVVAWDGDEIAGMILNFIASDENEAYDRKRGYTEDISVRRPWRRRGLASHMLGVSLQRLAEAGMTEAALTVDVDNPSGALTLYERAGYETVVRSYAYMRQLAS
jgi:mycothiol synthase